MTEKKDTTHTLIDRELVLAKRPRSKVLKCRYCIEGVWQHTTTGERDLKRAKTRAHAILVETDVRKNINAHPSHVDLETLLSTR